MSHPLTNIESREATPPLKELFGGEVKVLEKPSVSTFSVKVDGVPITFDVPKKSLSGPLFSGFWETLKKENIIYSPTTKSFHSLKTSALTQAREFLSLSYEEALQRYPKHMQWGFTLEAFTKSRSIAKDVLMRKVIPVWWVLLYSLFFHEIHKNSTNLRSYTKSAAGFIWFEAGAMVGAQYAPGAWKIPAALVWGAFWATVAWLLEDAEFIGMEKNLWKTFPGRASASDWKINYAVKTLTMDPALIYTTDVDLSDNPVEWTSWAKRRDALKWNRSLDVFQKKLVTNIAVLARSFREGTGKFDKKDGLEYMDEEGIKRVRPKKLMSQKEKGEVLLQELKKLLIDGTNPMFQQQAAMFANEIYAAIVSANDQKIDEFSTQLAPIIEQQASVFVTTMKIPKSFNIKNAEEKHKVSDFDASADMLPEGTEWYAIYTQRDQLLKNINGILKSIRETIADNKPNEINRPSTYKNIYTYVTRIMYWENPLGANESWNDILSDPTLITIDIGGVKQTKPLWDLLVILFNGAVEFRRIDKWMRIMNKNGNGHEWRIAPQWSIAGWTEDKMGVK